MKKIMMFCLAACMILAGTGCNLEEVIEELENVGTITEPEYVISVHRIVRYPRGEELEREVDTFSGGIAYVNINPFLHSRNIKKIDLGARPGEEGFYDLVLHLDKRGQMLWSSVAIQYRGEKMGLIIDGIFYRSFMPHIPNPDDIDKKTGCVTVLLEGPIDQATANNIVKFSEKNYKTMNR